MADQKTQELLNNLRKRAQDSRNLAAESLYGGSAQATFLGRALAYEHAAELIEAAFKEG